MVSRVDVEELRVDFDGHLRRVKSGETLAITEHGIEFARLTPPGTRDVAITRGPRSFPAGTTDAFLDESR